MRTQGSRIFLLGALFLVVFPKAVVYGQVSSHPLITQTIDETRVVTLRGNTHPLAQPQFDIGTAPPDMPLNRMLLVLKRSPQQDYALKRLLDDQQDKNSPNYHKWLTPDQFGQQFGVTDPDLQIVAGWLQTHGFVVSRVSPGRSVIEFSGVESQLESAFHTQIHQYLVNGQTHWANAMDPQIPAALAPAVAGLASLHNFPRHPMSELIGTYSPKTRHLTPANPLFTLPGWGCDQDGNCYAVGPADFGTIYNVQSLWNSGIQGTGQTIAIVGESDINIQDDRDFRTLFGLPANDPQIIYDGPNPGLQPDESEADIDVEWSGAIAPKATIDFVVSESTETTLGVDLSAIYIIDHNLAPVMSESYGVCELAIGTSGNQFYNSLWAQAAAQGITAILAAGDSGSATCDRASQGAQYGLEVSGFASTPYNVAIGGTDFNDFLNPQQYWNLSNTTATEESAKAYIPETTWNGTCTNTLILGDLGWGTNAENNCNNYQLIGQAPFLLYPTGGGGGASNCTVSNGLSQSSCSGGYSKPSWQVAPGVPTDGKRDVPDVSLFASNGVMGNFYIFCESDSQDNCNAGQYGAAGGTSFGAPAFAGIMALVNQQMQTPQGNANYVLYKLAGQQNAASCNSTTGSAANCVFNDITSGTIAMPCLGGKPNCTVQTPGHQYGVLSGYNTGTGYDLATGLGSINVANLVNKWNTVTFRPSITTLSLSPTANLTHGQAVTVTVSVQPSSGSGTPTGAVSLLTSAGVSAGGFTLNNGAVSGSTTLLPGGSYSVTAHYAGDSTFGGSDSTPVNVTIGKENSSSQIELLTFDWQGHLISANASTAAYGSPYLLRVDVLNSTGKACQTNNVVQSGCPTGNVALTDNGTQLDAGTYALNSFGYTEDQTAQFSGGSNSVKAQYAGDSSFNASSASATYSITPAPTTVTQVPSCCYSVGSPFQATVNVQAQSLGAAPTGTVTFLINGAVSPGSVFYQGGPGSISNPTATLSASLYSSSPSFPTPGTYTLTANYSGDANYAPAFGSPIPVVVMFPTPPINLTPSSGSIQPGSTLTLTAVVVGSSKTIAPTGKVSFASNAFGQLSANVSYSTITDPSGNLDLQAVMSFVPAGTDFYTATYSGDQNFPSDVSSTFGVTLIGNDFTLSESPSSITVTRGSQGMVNLTVGIESNSLLVNFGAGLCSGLPSEAFCSPSVAQIQSTGNVQLTVLTTAPHLVASTVPGSRHSSMLAVAGMPLAALLVLTVPRRRAWRRLWLCVLWGVLITGLGCGGGSGGGGGGGGGKSDPGTPPGTYTITVTANSGSGSGAITHTTTFTLVVQ